MATTAPAAPQTSVQWPYGLEPQDVLRRRRAAGPVGSMLERGCLVPVIVQAPAMAATASVPSLPAASCCGWSACMSLTDTAGA